MANYGSQSSSNAEFQQSVHAKQMNRARSDRRIIFANGSSVQVVRVAPWLAVSLVMLLVVGALGVMVSASYLFFRDELFTASIKRQHQIQVAYEDRVSDLRREIDRITSRQLLNQQAYEARVERLLAEHTQLYAQGTRLDGLLDQAGLLGLVPRRAPPSPVVPPNREASLEPSAGSLFSSDDDLITGTVPQLPSQRGMSVVEQAVVNPAGLLNTIEQTVEAQSHNQVVALASLTANANMRADSIVDELSQIGVRVDLPSADEDPLPTALSSLVPTDGIGGPLIEARPGSDPFALYVLDAERALIDLETARSIISSVPVAAPARGARLSSRFGNRRDPFTRRSAFHSGIDYAAPTGHPVYAPADGVVTRSSRAGGYGIMVEIDHPNGLSTRFAHLSRALVSVGTRVHAGDQIGRIGSTGRSTGPHLHYEVRRGSRAIDPMPFIRAGQSLQDVM